VTTLTVSTDRWECERATALLDQFAYARVGCPAIALEDDARAKLAGRRSGDLHAPARHELQDGMAKPPARGCVNGKRRAHGASTGA
jgi:hypothetical protein